MTGKKMEKKKEKRNNGSLKIHRGFIFDMVPLKIF